MLERSTPSAGLESDSVHAEDELIPASKSGSLDARNRVHESALRKAARDEAGACAFAGGFDIASVAKVYCTQ